MGETNEEFTVDTDYEGQTGTVIIESVLSEINGDVNMVIPAEVLDEISTIEGLEIMGVDGAAAPGAATRPEGATPPETTAVPLCATLVGRLAPRLAPGRAGRGAAAAGDPPRRVLPTGGASRPPSDTLVLSGPMA